MNLKKATLAGVLAASAFLTLPASAQTGSSATAAQTANTEFPGGIRAQNSADAQLTFQGVKQNVSVMRLTGGTSHLTVPPGKELKLELGTLVVQAQDNAELEASFDASGRPQVTCFGGLVGVTDTNGNHFRLGPNSVLSMGADGMSPTVRARGLASAAPAPASPPPVVTAPPAGPGYADDNEDEAPTRRPRRNRRRADSGDEGDNYTYQPPRSQGPSVGDTLLRSLPSIIGTVLPYMLNPGPSYYPQAGYYPQPGYYPNAGYPQPGYYPGTGFPFP